MARGFGFKYEPKQDYSNEENKSKKTVVGGIGTIYDGDKFVSHVGGVPFKNLEVRKKDFGSIIYKVSNDNYLKILNYVNGIKGLERVGDEIRPTFICVEGAIYFTKSPNSDKGHIVYDKDLKLSKDEELNKKLIKGLEKRLKE